jgi:hypothetical protein
MINYPAENEYPAHFKHYISLVKIDSGIKAIENQIIELQQFISIIPVEKENYAYAPGKWTVKEVIGHLCDTERIMGYRALCIARGEQKNLLSFDENLYVQNANFSTRSIYDLVHEFSIVRESNMAMFKSFDNTVLDKIGTANNSKVSVRAILFMIAGHEKHHLNILKERYLQTEMSAL